MGKLRNGTGFPNTFLFLVGLQIYSMCSYLELSSLLCSYLELSSFLLSAPDPGDITSISADSGGRKPSVALLFSLVGKCKPALLEEGEHQGVSGAVTHTQALLGQNCKLLLSPKKWLKIATFHFHRASRSRCPACCLRTLGGKSLWQCWRTMMIIKIK